MNAYYESLLGKIREEMQLNHWNAALQLIQGELDMPYVPGDILPVLEEMRQDCQASVTSPRIPGVQDLEKWIHGTPVQQEMAVSMLEGMNLRQFGPQVQQLFGYFCLDKKYPRVRGRAGPGADVQNRAPFIQILFPTERNRHE